jgi:cobalamin biosynthesis protein CobT
LVGLKSGTLDTNKLVEGVQGIQTIYSRKEKPILKKLVVSLLVDMSGSMSGSYMNRARECAILLTEVFSGNKEVDLYVYGYTGQNITEEKAELYEFYTPRNPRKFSLVNLRAIAQNLDGYSLLQMRDEIRKQTNEDVLTFMISDGEPAAHGYSGREAQAHLKECVTKLEKDKFKIVHIAVGFKGLPEIYKNLVTVEDVSTLANDLYLLVKRNIK